MQRLLASLRFQFGAAFGALIALFAAVSLTTLAAFERQMDADAVVDIAARLQLTASQMHMQSMNYAEHAPRDYRTYYRDVELFYRDLMAQVALFDAVVTGFMSGDFSDVLQRPATWMQPAAEPRLGATVAALEEAWQTHRTGLFEALGEDTEEPRLEWAAEYNIAHMQGIEAAANALADQLRRWAMAEHDRLRGLVMLMLGGAVALTVLLLLLLQAYGLGPLRLTLQGVRRAAGGDFGHQVPVRGATEIRDLAVGFNALSGKLDLLFQLLDRLQRGKDLDDLVAFLSRDFRELLRFDWIGVVLVTPDNATVRLEASALDGLPEAGSKPLFRLPGTLLAAALAASKPLHIRELAATAAAHPDYEFLRDIARRGLADAVFLPVAARTSAPAVVAFATREPGRYDDAHLEFLTNIAQLLSASFGRTVRFAERRRLAAIGEFASGIAHELRTPLATVSLALEHFSHLQLTDRARRRLVLAQAEATRMGRLVNDMLLYAKPLQLASEPVDLVALARTTAGQLGSGGACVTCALRVHSEVPTALVLGDRDRLQQVLTNLLVNACEATANGGAVEVRLTVVDQQRVQLCVENPGVTPPPELLERVFEPFVSAKQGGTGLGLAIVKRLTTLHGGEIRLERAGPAKTRARLLLPLCRGADDAVDGALRCSVDAPSLPEWRDRPMADGLAPLNNLGELKNS